MPNASPAVTRRRLLQMGGAAMLASLAPDIAGAKSAYPDKPIRVIVPFPPGGTTDIVTRLAAAELSRSLGQSVVTDNKPGAGTVIGVNDCAKSAPDGYTLVCVANSYCVNTTLVHALPYGPRDLQPVALMGMSDHVLAAYPGSKLHSLADLVQAAKQDPGKLSFASFGVGTSAHIAGEMLMAQTGIKMVHVPYKGQAPALNDLLGGQVTVMFGNWSEFEPYVRAGRLTALGMATEQRSPFARNVPTLAEQGARIVSNSWQGLLMPAKAPKAVAQQLNQAVNAALASITVETYFHQHGIRSLAGSIDDFRKFLDEETARYAKVIHDAHITVS
jgi:tripartite-type tricarboxylate transporter receptor subunit TctC